MNLIVLMRVYLLAGLVAHKAIWELLRWRQGGDKGVKRPPRPLKAKLVAVVKISILLSIIAQTVISFDVLPICASSDMIRIVGLVIYTIGIVVAVLGRLQLGENWSDIEEGQVIQEQQVVSRGLYQYIRHPIYVGDLLLLVGLELSLNSWLVLGIVALLPVVLLKAIQEDKMLIQTLPGYDDYALRTKRFIPYVM